MAKQVRIKTKYPGIFYIEGQRSNTSEPEKIYYIRYRRDGKPIEEKVGRQFQDDMTAAKANLVRANRIDGKELSNEGRRTEDRSAFEAHNSRWTIQKLWDEYLASKPNLKGVVTDKNRFINHIAPSFGSKEPSELALLDVDRLRLKVLKTHSSGTARNVMELLRRVINFGIKKRLCQPISLNIEMPKLNNQKTEDLSPEQLQRLLKVLDEDPNTMAANLMKLALYTGMRRSELFRLKWIDISFEKGFIHLREPKGGVDQKIPLNSLVKTVLENHHRTTSEYVFPGRGGAQRTDIKKQVNKIKEAAGLPKEFRALHGLRHVYASSLASSGKVDMYTLQKLLTHKSPQMTQRYAHLRDDAMQQAAETVSEVFSNLPTPQEKGKREQS